MDSRSKITDKEAFDKFFDSLNDSLTLDREHSIVLTPDFEAVFSAANSTRKKVNSSDLNLPPSINKEAQLAEQGYKTSYMGGVDQGNEWIVVRRRLQELNANPRTTHIEYFSDQVSDHIAHIRRGLEDHYSPTTTSQGSKLDQLKHLEALEKEAAAAISSEGVTYKWWLEFNNKLSKVMAGKDPKVLSKDSPGTISVEESLAHFPLKVIMPTTRAEDIGIIAFNRTGNEGVYPAGLLNKQAAEADGNVYDPPGFFNHDVVHSIFIGNQSYLGYSAGQQLLHGRILKNMERLPPDKRKKAEAVYFIMAHENTRNNLSSISRTPEGMKGHVMLRIRESIAGLFKFPDDPVEEQKKIEDLADTFMEVYNRAQQQQ